MKRIFRSVLTGQPNLYRAVQSNNSSKLKPPRIQHGLERVLFEAGPHFLWENEWKFDSYLEKIPQLQDFNMDKLKTFVRAAHDDQLHEVGDAALADPFGQVTRSVRAKFCSSTSSVTGVLAQIFALVTNQIHVNTAQFSDPIQFNVSKRLSPFLNSGTKIQLLYRNGVYTIDEVGKQSPVEDLMQYGHLLELFLTLNRQDFAYYLNNYSGPRPLAADSPESYHYGLFQKNIVLRSQLDSHHPGLPKKTFDLKTRALLPLRIDLESYKNHLSWYRITQKTGHLCSFEREHYDMVRNAFMKYSTQVRIGDMDGIFVAYHNTQTIFGFEYFSLEDMDVALYGSKAMGEQLFIIGLQILHKIVSFCVERFPKQDTKLFFAKPSGHTLDIFIESQDGAVVQLSVHSTSYVNGKEKARPAVKEGDEWKVCVESFECSYDHFRYTQKLRSFDKMYGGKRSGDSVIRALRSEMGLADDPLP
ncbi:hypothetical protein HDV03_003521 [Kappamyces sp. JEL0829]|nr:hypothetical protein HDV03_003521 [Kappamyces sp. JEL0829]